MFDDFIVIKCIQLTAWWLFTFTCKIYFSLIPNTRVILYCRKSEHNGAK